MSAASCRSAAGGCHASCRRRLSRRPLRSRRGPASEAARAPPRPVPSPPPRTPSRHTRHRRQAAVRCWRSGQQGSRRATRLPCGPGTWRRLSRWRAWHRANRRSRAGWGGSRTAFTSVPSSWFPVTVGRRSRRPSGRTLNPAADSYAQRLRPGAARERACRTVRWRLASTGSADCAPDVDSDSAFGAQQCSARSLDRRPVAGGLLGSQQDGIGRAVVGGGGLHVHPA